MNTIGVTCKVWFSLFPHKDVHSEEQEIVVATIILEDICVAKYWDDWGFLY